MIDTKTKIRIAQAVGINVHGHPPDIHEYQAVYPDSNALDEVVSILEELERKHKLRIGKLYLGMASGKESQEEVWSAIRVTKERLSELERQASSPEMEYVATTTRQYLDRLLSHKTLFYKIYMN